MIKNLKEKQKKLTTIYLESLDQSKCVNANVNPDCIITLDCKTVFQTERISILDAVLCIPKATKVELGEILIS